MNGSVSVLISPCHIRVMAIEKKVLNFNVVVMLNGREKGMRRSSHRRQYLSQFAQFVKEVLHYLSLTVGAVDIMRNHWTLLLLMSVAKAINSVKMNQMANC